MNKLLIGTVLGCLATFPVVGSAADASGFFVDGQIGRSKVNKSLFNGSDTGFSIDGGYRWGWLGVEAGYVDLGSFSADVLIGRLPTGLGPAQAKARMQGATLSLSARFSVADNWYVVGRGGILRFDARQDALFHGVDTISLLRYDETGFKPYAGAEFGYDFNDSFSIGLRYDYYQAKKNQVDLSGGLIAAAVEYHFR